MSRTFRRNNVLSFNKAIPPQVYKLCSEYAVERGLTEKMIRACRLEPKGAEAAVELGYRGLPFGAIGALKFPFLNIDGSPMFDPKNGREFFSMRLMGVDSKIPNKAPQPVATIAHPYYPPHKDWPEIAENTKIPIVIVEGEAKAICCMYTLGIPCIAIRGVTNGSLPSLGMNLLPELYQVKWKNRKVYICFDADIVSKRAVQLALTRIVPAFHAAHALVGILNLADLKIEGGKGLDDCIVRGATWEQILETTTLPDEDLNVDKNLGFLYEEIAMYHQTERILNVRTGEMQSMTWTRARYASLRSASLNDKRPEETISTFDRWLRSKCKKEIHKTVFDPKLAIGYSMTSEGEGVWNNWKGFIEPADDEMYRRNRGKVDLILRLARFVWSTDAEGEATAETMLDFISHIVQKPYEKCNFMPLVMSPEGGIGKSFLMDTYMAMFAPSAMDMPPDRFANAEKPFAILGSEHCIVIKVEEIDRGLKWNLSVMKSELTNLTRVIEPKHVSAYHMENLLRFWANSNQSSPLVVSDEERRIFVIKCRGELNRNSLFEGEGIAVYLSRMEGELRGVEVLRSLMRYHLERDISGFDAKSPPMVTEGMREMVADGGGNVRAAVDDAFDRMDGVKWAAEVSVIKTFLEKYHHGVTASRFYEVAAASKRTLHPRIEKMEGKTKRFRTFGLDPKAKVTKADLDGSRRLLLGIGDQRFDA